MTEPALFDFDDYINTRIHIKSPTLSAIIKWYIHT